MHKVYWTSTAEKNLDSIYDFISQHSEFYAKRMIDRLTRRSIQIANFPYSGRFVPEYENEEIREVIEGPYRIIYYINSDRIDVLSVIHGTQNVISITE